MTEQGWDATWIESRYVTGVVFATSKSQAEKLIRDGRGVAIQSQTRSCSSPIVHGRRNPWRPPQVPDHTEEGEGQ